jgi:hypothetical protein
VASIKIEYASSSALTITLASLATSSTKLVGRESGAVDNTSNKYVDYLIAGKITTGTSPTAAKSIEVHVIGLMEDSTYPDVFDGTDSAETITNAEIKASICRQVAYIQTTSTSDVTYGFGPVSVASRFGGVMPKKFVVFVTHDTAVNLNSTGGNQAIHITPVYYTSA